MSLIRLLTNPTDSANADDRTGWLQDPRARPFYTTRVLIAGDTNLRSDQVNFLRKIHYPSPSDPVIVAYQPFNADQWSFYQMPDTAAIPHNRIYYG